MDHPPKNRTIITISLLTIATGIVIMAGWIFHIPAFQQLIPGFIAIKFNSALCFVLFGIVLVLTQYPERPYNTPFYLILSLLGTLIALITLSQDVFHYSTGIDQLFITDNTSISSQLPFPGRMAFNAAAHFALLGLGFLTLTSKSRSLKTLAQYYFHIVTILSAVALIGYLYGVSLFYSLFYQTSMPVHTAFLFFILSMGASLINPSIGITNLFTGKQVGNQMAKRLFGLIILIVIVFGSLRLQVHHSEQFSLETCISLLAVSFLLASLLIIWNTANWLNNIDNQRSAAEDEVKLMNADLEERMEKRSGELLALFEKLKQSEEKYRSLIEHASDAIFVIDLAGNFTETNASMCQMMGYSKEELLQLKIQQIIDPEDLKISPFDIHFGNRDQSRIKERRLIRKDGSVYDAELNVKLFPDDRILVIARDITSRKKMEAELREAELKFRTIAEKSMVGIYIVQKGKFVYVNPRFAAIFGYEPQEMINTFDIEQVFDESYRATASENVRKRMQGEVESVHYEALCKLKNGSNNWVEFYGSRAMFGDEPTIIGSMIDITERKNAEEILKRSEANLQTILRITDTAYALFNKDLEVEAFNHMAIQFVKAQFHHVPKKGDKLFDFFPQHRLQQFKQYAADVLAGKNISYEIDYPQANGKVYWYSVRLFPITNDNNDILGLMMALGDITERKNANENLKTAYQSIQSHIKSIKQMAWKQSHVMRRPLANLKALAAILKDNPTDEVTLNHIKTELDSLDTTINEMAEDASDYAND